jgi:hypothetical protein
VKIRDDSSGRRGAAIEELKTPMDEDIPLPFDLPALVRKKVSTAFDGGRIISDGGVMLLAQAERLISSGRPAIAAACGASDRSGRYR